MNNEFNNNQQGDYTDSNANPDNINMDSSISNNDRGFDNSYSTRNISSGNTEQVNVQADSNNNFRVYTTPTETEEKKPKKKSGFRSVFKLTASAVVFGLIAGMTFQAYYMVTQPTATIEDNNSSKQIAQITQTASSNSSVVAATTSSGEVVSDVSDVVANVMPSIVAINCTSNVSSYDFFGREYSQEAQSSGSGIIIGQNNSNLLIVTNNHVIEGATTVQIVFADESTAEATVKGADANADLAVLTLDMSSISKETAAAIKVATLGNSEKVQAGDIAIAIGNALGYGQSVTVGYISAVNREVTIGDQTMTLLQTDAAINPGNSGGALLNAAGEVIGINSVKYASAEVEGMGYAIPISKAIPMMNELINRETIAKEDQGFLGIDASKAQDVTQEYADRFNMPIGVYVNAVIEGSPAEAAGLMQGDIITGLDGTTIETIKDLISALSYKKAGQEVNLVIQAKENGAYVEKTLKITLGNK